nr:uncharacterized protein LOC109169864 [Ipomoea trifida]
MKKLTNSTIIGKKRKKIAENKENEIPQFPLNSVIRSPGTGNELQQSNHYVFGVFEKSINSPLSSIFLGGKLVKSSITCTKKLCQGERSNKEPVSAELTQLRVPFSDLSNVKSDVQGSLCQPNQSNMTRLRSSLSFDYCRNLEDEFAQTVFNVE